MLLISLACHDVHIQTVKITVFIYKSVILIFARSVSSQSTYANALTPYEITKLDLTNALASFCSENYFSLFKWTNVLCFGLIRTRRGKL